MSHTQQLVISLQDILLGIAFEKKLLSFTGYNCIYWRGEEGKKRLQSLNMSPKCVAVSNLAVCQQQMQTVLKLQEQEEPNLQSPVWLGSSHTPVKIFKQFFPDQQQHFQDQACFGGEPCSDLATIILVVVIHFCLEGKGFETI